MNLVKGIMENVVPISSFNKGIAGKIFEEVKHSGMKVVMKNNAPECILLSPEDYLKLIDEVNDAKLMALAMQRMHFYDAEYCLSEEDGERMLGFSKEDMDDFEGVEFE